MTNAPIWKTIVHPLLHPVTVGEGSSSRTVEKITLKEPTQENVEAIDEAGVGMTDRMSVKQMRICIEQLSGEPTDVIKRLHVADFTAIGAHLGPLLESFSGEASPGDTSTE